MAVTPTIERPLKFETQLKITMKAWMCLTPFIFSSELRVFITRFLLKLVCYCATNKKWKERRNKVLATLTQRGCNRLRIGVTVCGRLHCRPILLPEACHHWRGFSASVCTHHCFWKLNVSSIGPYTQIAPFYTKKLHTAAFCLFNISIISLSW